MARRTFESVFRFLVPSWLLEGDGDGVLRSLTRTIDENTTRFRNGLVSRFPTYATAIDGALEGLGQDRGIIRGRVETAAHYAARLVAWRYPRGHRVRGSAFALLNQVSEYWGSVSCQTIDRQGTLHERTAYGVERYEYGLTWAWDTEASSKWSRFWMVIDATPFAAENPDPPALWGGTYGLPGYTIGQTGVQFEDVQAMRRLMTGRAWRPAGTQPEWIILVLDVPPGAGVEVFEETFDETFGAEPALPTIEGATTWAHWSRINGSGVQVEARDPRYRYISLDPEHNNLYDGYPANFCASATMPDGTTYAGDPDSFPASTTIPGGLTYAGNPASFPVDVRLVDDGDPPP